MKSNIKDPFLILLRKEALTHFMACASAFLLLAASRYAGLQAAGADAILLTPSSVGLVADFFSAVVMLTFFRVLYGIPLWWVRPSIRRMGTYVLFTLVFGAVFTIRTQQALGARIEQRSLHFFYPFPKSPVVIPIGEISPPRWKEARWASSVGFPEPRVQFVPVFHFDSTGQARLHSLFDALNIATTRDH